MKLINELRVDNYILFKEYGEGDGKIGQMKRGDFGRFDKDEYFPIPLTEEWLKRCGKKCIDRTDWEYQINVGALKWYFRWNTEWYSELGGIYLDSRIRHLHQVQNLYLDLTGNELPIISPSL